MGKGGSVVGLNIGTSTIKAVELLPGRGGIEVMGLGIMPTPDDTMSNGVIVAPDVLGGAIKDMLSSSGIRSKAVVSSVAGQSSLVIRIIEVPKMSDSELKETMSYEIERHIPFAATEVMMDYKPLHPADENPDAQNMEVLLCVAQEDMINAHVQTLEAAGLLPRAIDVEPLAAARATIELLGEPTPGETVGILNIGSSIADISVMRDGLLTFTRAVPVAGDALTQALIETFGVEKFEAERIKNEMGTAILEQEDAQAVDFSAGAVGAESADFDAFTGDATGEANPDFDFSGMEEDTGGAEGATPFGTTSEQPVSEPGEISFANPFLTAEAGAPAPTPEADLSAAFAAPAAAENPFDLSLDAPSTPAPEPAIADNPFDLSLDAPLTMEAPQPAPAVEANPFDLSLDLSAPAAAAPAPQETPPPAVAPAVPDFSLSFGETEPVAEEDIAPAVGSFDLGELEEPATPAEPLFDLAGPAVAATPAAPTPTASPGMNPLLHGGGQTGGDTASDTGTAAVSPGMNPFLQGGTGATAAEGTGGEDYFGQENPFADSVMTSFAPQTEVTPLAVFQSLSPVLGELVAETRRSLEYYTSRYPDAVISRLVVLGGTARLKHLDKFLSNELGIRVVIANPFEQLTIRKKDIPPEYAEELAPSLAISVGLALRDML